MSAINRLHPAVITIIFTIAGVLTPCLVILNSAEPEQSDQSTVVRGLVAAWQQNRSGLARFSCRYHLKKAKAATREDALAGRLSNVFVADGIWAVDGEAERCTLDVDDKAVPKTVTKTKDGTSAMTAPISSKAFVTNGPIKLFSGAVIGAATLYGEPLGPMNNDIITPFSMGFRSTPAEFIERHLSAGKPYEVRDGTGLDGGEGITVVLDLGSGNRYSYTFDPHHGFLISRMTTETAGRVSTEVYVTAARQSPDGHWFPMSSVKLNLPSKDGQAIAVQRIEVTELDFSPESRDFAVTLPANTKVVDRADAHSQHRLRQPLEITPTALPDLETHLREVAAAGQGGRPLVVELAQPRQANWWLIVGATVLTAIVAWLLLRRFRWSDTRV